MPTSSFDVPRSPKWPQIEKAHLAREPVCVCCGPLWKEGTSVQVHHIFPVHYCLAAGRPDLELDPRNLVTLCQSEKGRPSEDHHLLVGHLGNFELMNPASRTDALGRYHGLVSQVIALSGDWHVERAHAQPVLAQMTPVDRQLLRMLMDRTFPRTAR